MPPTPRLWADGHRTRKWLGVALVAWSIALLAVGMVRFFLTLRATPCPADESVAAFCRSALLSSAIDSLKLPAVVYAAGLAAVVVMSLWTMLDREGG